MKSAGELVVDAAARHLLERRFRDGEQMLLLSSADTVRAADRSPANAEIWARGRSRRSWYRIARVTDRSVRVDHFRIECRARAGEVLRLARRRRRANRGLFQISARVLDRRRQRPSGCAGNPGGPWIFGREIRAAEKWPAIGQQKSRERPAALPRNRADGRLIARVHVGTLVAIHFHGNEKFVDDARRFGDFRSFRGRSRGTSGTTPRRYRAGSVCLRLRARESVFAPFVPVDRLVRGGAQIRAGGIFQSILRMVGQRSPFELGSAGRLLVRGRAVIESSGQFDSNTAPRFARRVLARGIYCKRSPGPRSRGSSGLRPAKPSSCR